jgi:hypothetical protein
MHVQVDWKFVLTLAAAVAGVLIPVWLWQADLSSKAINLKVVSTAELRPENTAQLEGIQLLLDGQPVDRPFVSLVELKNTGSRPITTADFESPIELSVKLPAKLLKAQVTGTDPAGLRPTLQVNADAVSLSPLLLNSGDQVQITLLTTGPRPEFDARARVAGVSALQVTNFDPSRSERREWLRLVTATLLLVLYMNLVGDFVFSLRRRTFKPWHLASGLVACMGGVLLGRPSSPSGQFMSSSEFTMIGIAGVVSLLFLLLRMPARRGAA